jgi:hypothetical protein
LLRSPAALRSIALPIEIAIATSALSDPEVHQTVGLVDALHAWMLTSSTNIQVRGPLLTSSL